MQLEFQVINKGLWGSDRPNGGANNEKKVYKSSKFPGEWKIE